MKPTSKFPDIFSYSDYRKFLIDAYLYNKKNVPGYTYETIAVRAGFSSPSFIKLVIDGKKNVSKKSAGQIAEALRLKNKQRSFFLLLVDYNQESDLEKKARLIARIDAYRKRNHPTRILPEDYRYLSQWYYCVIREMTDLPDWVEDPKSIAQKLRGGVSPAQVREALDFLTDQGFLVRDDEGKLIKKDKTLSTGDVRDDDMFTTMARKFHVQMVHRALESIEQLPSGQRHVTNTTLSLSAKSYAYALKRIESLRMELLELAASDNDVDSIYQLTVNLFPFITAQTTDE